MPPQRQFTRRQFFRRIVSTDEAVAPDSLFTPTEQFFRVLRPTPPLQVDYWSFTIGGLAQHPRTWSYDDLRAYPAETSAYTLLCAAHTPREPRIAHANWAGVPLRSLLAELDIHPSARFAHLRAADGHATCITVEQLESGLLATGMNAATLAPEHGFPARLIVPGLYDHKQPRWIERADLVAEPVMGAWEGRDWPAAAQPTAALLQPRHLQPVTNPVTLKGFAFAGAQAITALHINVDDGDWLPVPVDFETTPPNTWTRWAVEWNAPAPGDYQIGIRITAVNREIGLENQHIRVIDS